MGQQEIYDFLRKNKQKWFSTKDLSSQLNTSIGSVTNCIKKLRNSSFVNFKEDPDRKLGFLYRFKK